MNNRSIMVVGGSRGLGRYLSQKLQMVGAHTTIVSRTPPQDNGNGRYIQCDITNYEQVESTARDWIVSEAKLDGLVFCQRFRSSGDDWIGEIATTLTATKNLITLFQANINDGASIVLVSSVNSRYVTQALPAGYHVAKAGLVQLARFFAVQFGSRRIRTNVISPGTFVKPETVSFYSGDDPRVQVLRRKPALLDLCTCEDVSNAIIFFLGDESRFVTGQELVVDGGASLFLHESS